MWTGSAGAGAYRLGRACNCKYAEVPRHAGLQARQRAANIGRALPRRRRAPLPAPASRSTAQAEVAAALAPQLPCFPGTRAPTTECTGALQLSRQPGLLYAAAALQLSAASTKGRPLRAQPLSSWAPAPAAAVARSWAAAAVSSPSRDAPAPSIDTAWLAALSVGLHCTAWRGACGRPTAGSAALATALSQQLAQRQPSSPQQRLRGGMQSCSIRRRYCATPDTPVPGWASTRQWPRIECQPPARSSRRN
jgi:hypothetical protein